MTLSNKDLIYNKSELIYNKTKVHPAFKADFKGESEKVQGTLERPFCIKVLVVAAMVSVYDILFPG